MANNNALYNAVLTGTVSALDQRSVVSPASVSGLIAAANTLATLIDASIAPIVGGATADQVATMRNIVAATVSQRLIRSTNAADYTRLAQGVINVWTQYTAALLPVLAPKLIAGYFGEGSALFAGDAELSFGLVLPGLATLDGGAFTVEFNLTPTPSITADLYVTSSGGNTDDGTWDGDNQGFCTVSAGTGTVTAIIPAAFKFSDDYRFFFNVTQGTRP